MTRWHEDDLVGRLLKHIPHRCKVINIPLEAEHDDILGRKVGDALFPEIGKDNAWLKEFKELYIKGEGSRTWNALMQGRPTAEEGNMIKREWWKFYETAPRCVINIMSIDATFKDTSKSDYVAIQVWGKRGNDYYLIDRLKQRMGFVDTVQAIRNMKAKYPFVGGIYIEDKANGSAIIDVLRRQIQGVVGYNPGKNSKESRVQAITPIIEAGQVHLPKFGQNIDEYIGEASAFPNSANDKISLSF